MNDQEVQRIERYLHAMLGPIKAEVADVKVAINAEAEVRQVLYPWFAVLAVPKVMAKCLAGIEAAVDRERQQHAEAVAKERAPSWSSCAATPSNSALRWPMS